MVPVGVAIILIGVGAGALAEGPLAGVVLAITVGLLVLAAACWAVGLSGRIRDLRVVVPALIVLGLCGAALDWPHSDGPGFLAGYMALAGLALRVPRITALLAGVPIVAAIAASDAHAAENPASTVLSVALGCGFLFVTSALVALSQDAHQRAEALLAQEAAIREAREQTATLAERSRLARELHDVLAHCLSSLSLQLEGARLRASQTGADAMLFNQISSARQAACDGMVSAQRAVQALRGDDIPGLARLPRLVTDSALSMRIPIDFQVDGKPWPLRPEAELTAYRTVQEALTNVAKHAGRGARVRVGLSWTPDCLDISVADSGGDGADAGLVSTGLGLTSMAERAALHGGQLTAGPAGDGFSVRLTLPLRSAARLVGS
jgi:signal transduction histidine kinase